MRNFNVALPPQPGVADSRASSLGTRSGRFGGTSMYCDELLPSEQPKGWVVLVHGGAFTGRCYLETTDGSPGWAYDLRAQGFAVIVVDWPGVGRSGYVDPNEVSGASIVQALADAIALLPEPPFLLVHSMSGPFGFSVLDRHASRVKALIAIAPGPPGNVQEPAIVVRETSDTIVVRGPSVDIPIPRSGNWMPEPSYVEHKFIGASRRSAPGAVESMLATNVPISSRLILERVNYLGGQLRLGNPRAFAGTPILIMTGEFDADHPYHADARTADWLRAEGNARVDYVFADSGEIAGNGHMPMLESNSAAWSAVIAEWMLALLSAEA